MTRPKIVSLNRERDRRRREDRDEAKAWLLHRARQAPEDIDGFGLVMFRHDKSGLVTTRTHYFVKDAMDGPRLPDLARQELARYVSEVSFPDEIDDEGA